MESNQIFLTPAEQMKHIREVVNAADAEKSKDAAMILATYFSRLDTLRAQIAALEGHMLLHEHPFESRTPLIGPVIVKLRYLWNWMSTKWYILPIMKQQNDFNMAVTKTLRETLTTVESLAQSVQHMQAQLAELNIAPPIEASDEKSDI